MYYSRSMWIIIRDSYLKKKFADELLARLTLEVGTKIPRFMKKKKYKIVKAFTNGGKIRFVFVKKRLCGYPLYRHSFAHKFKWRTPVIDSRGGTDFHALKVKKKRERERLMRAKRAHAKRMKKKLRQSGTKKKGKKKK